MSNAGPSTYTTRLTRKSQITVPSSVREKLGLAPGDRGIWIVRKDEVVLVSAKQYAEATAGIVAGTYGHSPGQIRRYLQRERAGWS